MPGLKSFITKALEYRIVQLSDGEKYWQKVYLKGLVGKSLANAILNKTICADIINNYF